MRRVLTLLCALAAAPGAAPIGDAYRDAKAAIEAGDSTRAVELLAPFDTAGDAPPAQLAVARLALARAYLDTGKPAEARGVLERATPALDATPQAAAAHALLGDACRLAGARAEAQRAYETAAERAADTVLAKYSRARLDELRAEAAEAAGDFKQAAELYLAAGDAMLALGPEDAAHYADARALFEKVARGSAKAPPGGGWRGEPTARAVFSMGEVERAQGRWAEAVAYYQRTFVSWVKYPQWPARAYLRAAECMEKLGRRDFAERHLGEMLRKRDKYGKLPEYEEAKRQLRAWGHEVP